MRHGSFDTALRDAPTLMGFGATPIGTVDSKVLGLAQDDIVGDGVRKCFPTTWDTDALDHRTTP